MFSQNDGDNCPANRSDCLIYYVSEKRPDLLDAVCDKLYLAVTKIQDAQVKNIIISNAGAFSYATRFVIDLFSVKKPSSDIIGAIEAFRSINGSARVIVLADGVSPGNPLITRLLNIGVYDILVDINEENLERSLTTGFTRDEAAALWGPIPPEALPPKIASAIGNDYAANKDFKKHKQYIAIAICAAEAHMGATHQALLMAKFLSSVGFRVCYIEAGKRRKIFYLAQIYPINANEKMRLIQFEGIDMYFDADLNQILGMGYDFYIYDFGRLEEMDAHAFMSKDMRFVVVGAKAWEMPSYNPVLNIPGAERSFSFIVNFAPPREMAMIQNLMGEFRLYFSEYVPYPFESNVNVRIYKEIFKQYLTAAQPRGGRKNNERG